MDQMIRPQAPTPHPRFMVVDPAHFDVSYVINPWMDPDQWARDRETWQARARAGATDLHAALREAGAAVEIVPASPGLPDLVFPANAGIVLDRRVLPARFAHKERQGEEAPYRAAFEGFARRGLLDEVGQLPDGCFQEGAGDCIWDDRRDFFWTAYGQRSIKASLDQIAGFFGRTLVALELVNPRFYHLDTCFCPLSGGEVLYYPGAFDARGLATIREHVAADDLIEASDEDAAAFCVNAVSIDRTLIMAAAPARLKARLAERGYAVRDVDLVPFILSGGGAYCMTLRLDRARVRALLAA